MRLTVGYGTFDGGKYTIPTDAELREQESRRRWRAAFGKEGGCEHCGGAGKVKVEADPGVYTDSDGWYRRNCCQTRIKHDHSPSCHLPLVERECWHCCGTGRGEHER